MCVLLEFPNSYQVYGVNRQPTENAGIKFRILSQDILVSGGLLHLKLLAIHSIVNGSLVDLIRWELCEN